MIEDYDSLKAAIATWLMREDQDTLDMIPVFINMAESQFNRVLRTANMTRRATTSAEDRYLKLPNDWISSRNVQRNDSGVPLEFKTMPELDTLYSEYLRNPDAVASGPIYYGFIGGQMELVPPPSPGAPVPLELTYYGRIPPLSDITTSNWLLTRHPDIYLYAALVHSAPFLKDDTRVPVWKAAAEQAMIELDQSNKQAATSGGTMSRPITGMR